MKDVRPIDPKLVENLRQAKTILHNAQQLVEDSESAIYLAAGKLPEKGTVHCEGVKISVGFYRKWSQEKLKEIETTWVRKSNLPFPFKREFKEDAKAVSYIEENAKEAYDVLAEALTLTPRKPSFEITDKE